MVQLYQGDKLAGTTSTDYLGSYRFNLWNVNNGTSNPDDDGIQANTAYEIRIVGSQTALSGLKPTISAPGQAGSDELRDSDFTPNATGAILDFTTTTDEHYLNLDGGFARTGSIGDLIWLDANNNGRKDAKEKGIAGVTVRLLDETSGNEVANTTTAADGSYRFEDLLPGSYVVQIADSNFVAGGVLFGCASSTGKPGQITGLYEGAGVPDPNIAKTNGVDHGFADGGVVQSLAVNVGTKSGGSKSVDFGFFRSSGLSGRVYVDQNGNGHIDPEDMNGLKNVRVFAAGPAGVFSTFTDSDGNYDFANLPAGSYNITLPSQPAGYKRSTPNIVTTGLPLGEMAHVNFGEAQTVDLRIRQSATPAIIGVGGIIQITYRVTNLGAKDATGVNLNAFLPAAFKFLSVDAGNATYDAITQSATIGTVAPGQEVVIKVRAHVIRAGSFRLRATATANETEDNLANNQSIVWVATPSAVIPAAIGGSLNWLLGSAHH